MMAFMTREFVAEGLDMPLWMALMELSAREIIASSVGSETFFVFSSMANIKVLATR